MAVPSLFSMTLPMLQLLGDEDIHNFAETVEHLANHFDLTEAEKNERVPIGVQTRLANRTGWARTEMRNAGLLEYTSPGCYRITERGSQVLAEKVERIDRAFLNQFEEYRRSMTGPPSGSSEKPEIDTGLNASENTPEEELRRAYGNMREFLADEILVTIKKCSPTFFENLVLDVLVRMGYGGSREEAAEAVGQSGDEGIDGIINEDRLGLEVIYVQAKRWENNVGRPQIQQFAGALQGKRARKGVFITTSSFTQDARRFVDGIDNKIILVDGTQLAEYMIEYSVGVTTEATYEIKRVDNSYFQGE